MNYSKNSTQGKIIDSGTQKTVYLNIIYGTATHGICGK
jgi:hypothetical protein